MLYFGKYFNGTGFVIWNFKIDFKFTVTMVVFNKGFDFV